jgi:hypothetical protein
LGVGSFYEAQSSRYRDSEDVQELSTHRISIRLLDPL